MQVKDRRFYARPGAFATGPGCDWVPHSSVGQESPTLGRTGNAASARITPSTFCAEGDLEDKGDLDDDG
jgi:hypothetical protein